MEIDSEKSNATPKDPKEKVPAAPKISIDQKCQKYWDSMFHSKDLNKKERTQLSRELQRHFEANMKQYGCLKSCLPCIEKGCERGEGDIICTRCDDIKLRVVDPDVEDLWGFLCKSL
jgi:hypothetical protein